jgi:putative hydrolase of the HAD superfamily
MIEIDENGYGGIRSFIPRLSKLWKLPLSIEEFINERNEIFGKLSTPLPDLYEVLDYLKDKYKLGIITNGYSTVQRDKIKAVGIEHYFDNILVSGDGNCAKPDPRIFQLSCEYLEIRPEEAVYVGDYFPNDIVGSIGANIMPIWIDEGLDEHLEYDGIKITGLRALLDYL